jgi:hypothetical protein
MNNTGTKGVTRYVVTHLNKDRERTLFDPQQGQYTFDTYEGAQRRIYALTTNNDLSRFVPFPDSLQVRPCECWPVHFDPKGIWFD